MPLTTFTNLDGAAVDLTSVSTTGWRLYHKQVVVRNDRRYVSVGRMIRDVDKNQKVILR